jgi:5-methylcytosine-specific restriction endonuclease McrA
MPEDKEVFLRRRFEARWKNIEQKSIIKNLVLPDKEKLWSIILTKYRTKFVCEYCGQQLLICDHIPPYYKSFSIDHRTSIFSGGKNNLENIAIICTRCNIIKGTMTEQTYRAFLKPLLENPQLLDQVYKEMWNGRLANKIEREDTLPIKKETPVPFKNNLPSDSTLPGCIGNFNNPLDPNKPCSKCRDKDFCEKSYNGFGIEVQAWQDGIGSKYTPIIGKDWPSCLGNANHEQRQGVYCLYEHRKCIHQYLCGYIWRT